MRTPLHIVQPDEIPAADTLAERIARLQSDLRTLNAEQSDELNAALLRVAELAFAISENTSQPAGIRDLARRASEDCEMRAGSLQGLIARSKS